MNEDKEMVPVSQLREAEAERDALQKTLNSWRTMTCTWCGLTMPYTPEMHNDIEAKINEHALTCKYDPRNIEIKAMRAELREAEARAERAEAKLSQVYQLTLDKTYSEFSALGEINHITEPPAHDAGKDAE